MRRGCWWSATRSHDRHIADLPKLLRRGDLLVFNDTRVIPARLLGRRGAATIEVTLHRDLGQGVWRAFAKGAKRLQPGDRLVFAEDFAAEVDGERRGGRGDAALRAAGAEFRARARRATASMPLPPYIKRPPGGDARDRARLPDHLRARSDGAVAAPTAGLHFTPAAAGGARRAPGSSM